MSMNSRPTTTTPTQDTNTALILGPYRFLDRRGRPRRGLAVLVEVAA
jgi:hypothetical protein